MSKSKKNTIDPENIISSYGADAARLFILSDSPPEKDVQWSEEGIKSSFKFIQKLWTLNTKIIEKIKENHKKNEDDEITKYTNKFLKKVTDNLENFSYNKIIANLHEMHSFFTNQINKNYTKETLLENYQKILIAMQPVVPHFSNECLEIINIKSVKWPNYNKEIIKEEKINLVIQINGKVRDKINIGIDTTDDEIKKQTLIRPNVIKWIDQKKIRKIIIVKGKIINIVV